MTLKEAIARDKVITGICSVWVAAFLALSLGYLYPGEVSCPEYEVLAHFVNPILASVFILFTIALSLHRLSKGTLSSGARVLLLGFWLVTPAMWFSFEYFKLYRPIFISAALRATTQSEAERTVCLISFDQFKYGQDSAEKIWAGVVAFLAALYVKSETEARQG